MTEAGLPDEQYSSILREYLQTHGEAALYHASLLGQAFVEQGLGPDEIIALHTEALDAATSALSYRQRVLAAAEGLQFLLEVMIAFGVHHKQYLELRLAERTRAVEAQAALDRQQRLEAEHLAEQRSDLLAAIAHELNTPITAAQGSLDLALRALDRGRPDALRQRLDTAKQAIARLGRLSAELQRASRNEPPELQHELQDLAQLVAQACGWAEAAASEKGVSLSWSRDLVSLPISGDADALLTVVGNLLSNAIRYTPAGGTVTVTLEDRAGAACLEVRDTGIGMSPEVQGQIFRKFFRAPEARQVSARGLGLGLALVQQLVTAHGGAVSVESSPGAGSTFRVTLPRARAAAVTTGEEAVHG